MTNEERRKAAEWFRNRAKNCPMPGARRMYEIATEALEMAIRALSGDGDTIYRQDAIDACCFGITHARAINVETGAVVDLFAESNKELHKAIERIEALPSAQPEILACGSGELVQESDSLVKDLVKDCISRKMAIDAVSKWLYDVFGIKESDGTATIFKRLRELPSAQPRKKGKWINHRNDDGHNIADCDQCGNAIQWFDGDEVPRYCCMCGADMRGER